MLICDKCGKEIPEGSSFCPHCADPVTAVDRIDVSESIRLVCPKCEKQALYPVDKVDLSANLKCPHCKAGFSTRIVKIRSKRSRGDKKGNKRTFSIRVVDSNGIEDLIEFENASYGDFELRARDVAAFSYFKGELKVVQNKTIGQYMTVSKPQCYLATNAFGPYSEEVKILRDFRDRVLSRSFLAPSINWYYWISPYLIRHFGNSRLFGRLSRILLRPVILLAKNLMS